MLASGLCDGKGFLGAPSDDRRLVDHQICLTIPRLNFSASNPALAIARPTHLLPSITTTCKPACFSRSAIDCYHIRWSIPVGLRPIGVRLNLYLDSQYHCVVSSCPARKGHTLVANRLARRICPRCTSSPSGQHIRICCKPWSP